MKLPVMTNRYTNSKHLLAALFSIAHRSHTDYFTALPRPHALDSAAAVGLGRATPHVQPR